MSKKPYFIGIAGGTCSGKSTVSGIISEKLAGKNVRIVNMDSYFKRPLPTTIAPITGIEYVEANHPDSLKLDELYADIEAFSKDESIDVLIVEGLFALKLDQIREKCDLKIFVDLKSDERIVRRVKRFLQRGDSFDEIVNRYLDTVRYRHDELIEPTRWFADIVLNGTLPETGVDVILSYIKQHIGE